MIWDSTFLMTVIDLAIVGMSLAMAWVGLNGQSINLRSPSMTGARLIVLGVFITGLFYSADLATMFILPEVIGQTEAMEVMEYLHLNFRWLVSLVAMLLIFLGFFMRLREIDRDITERENVELKSQQTLQETLHRFQGILDTTHDAIISVDEAQQLVNFNQGACHIFGYAPEEILGQPLDMLLPEAARIAHRQHVSTFAGTANTARKMGARAEITGRRKTGEVFPAEASISKVLVGGQWIFTAILRDITERKQAEAALQESSEQFRLAFEKGPLGIVFADKAGQLLKVNDAFCAMLGYTTKELEGRSFLDITHPDDIETSVNVAERIWKEPQHPLAFEKRYLRKNGSVMWGHLTVSHFTPKYNKTLLVMGMVEDITGRKTSELHSKIQYGVARVLAQATTFEQATKKILEAVCQTLDWSYGGLWKPAPIEHHLRCAVTWSKQTDQLRSFETKTQEMTFSSGIGLPGQVWAKGEPAWIRDVAADDTLPRAKWANEAGLHGAFAFPIYLENTIYGIMEFFSYETQDPDEELLRMMETLGHQIGQFAQRKELEEQIRQTQKMDAIGQLAGGIAHDFNNVLTAIVGYGELIVGAAPHGSNLRDNADQVLIAAERAKQLVKQILVFSQEPGDTPKPMWLSPIIDETLALLRASFPTTIKIRTAISAPNSQVMADATHLHQVIMNLCTNAKHAMHGTSGVLDIELDEVMIESPLATQHGMAPGNYVRLRIADTGQGMPPEVVDRIFEPFFTTKGMSGTGMGLAVVHGIIKNYRGAITAKSTVGLGTTMTVWLPASTQTTLEPHIPASKVVFTGQERILYIDDEKPVLKAYKHLLEQSGYTVVTCESGIDALERFRSDPTHFDLAVTDETMPDIAGGSLAQALLDIRPDLPIILCTGYSAVTSREDAKAIGIRAYLMKPVTIHQLTKAIRNVIDSSKAAGT